MPTHYVYREPNKKVLCQGDILSKTETILKHLQDFHPYYADHDDYKFFMVLTQSCDLVRRDGKFCASPYITMAAVRPVETVLLREAAKRQDPWQKPARVISAKERENLLRFLASLIDNNKERYFYVHSDVECGIDLNCCAFLQLAVTLKAEHYQTCLDAKICELDETFQAKLGHLIGHMYNRVGTTEWNNHYPDQDVDAMSAEVIDANFVTFEDRQIKEGVAELKKLKKFNEMQPIEIRDYINTKIVLPWRQQFEKEVLDLLTNKFNLVGMLQGKLEAALRADAELSAKVDQVLLTSGVPAEGVAGARDALLDVFRRKLREHLSDDRLPGKSEVMEKLLARLLSESSIAATLRT
jgi:hypothetical protein